MEREENKKSFPSLSHRPWKSPQNGDFTHYHRTAATAYTDISNGRITLSFLLSANKQVNRTGGAQFIAEPAFVT